MKFKVHAAAKNIGFRGRLLKGKKEDITSFFREHLLSVLSERRACIVGVVREHQRLRSIHGN
jgi:hypothetical protein